MPIHRDACPTCGSTQIEKVLIATDHTVSQESFPVWHCSSCTQRFTQDVPDAETIGPYYQSEEYVSHSNTSKGLINTLYQRVRAITLSQKRALVARVSGKSSGNLLDVGCGTGEFLHTMKEAGWTCRGLEPDEGARAFAKTQYSLHVTAAEDLYTLAGTYDVVTLWHVLEHVHDLHPYLNRLRELVAASGTLLIAVPNYTSADAKTYGANWAAYDVPRHLYHFSPESMRQLLAQHSIEVQEMLPMPFDAFYVSMLSEKYQHGSTRLLRAFLNGWQSYWPAREDATKSSSVIYVCRAS